MRDVRIWFKKEGDARYISHLDLVRLFTRCLKKGRIPVWYTEGFNPRPYMAFALPMSVGTEGLREALDVRIDDDSFTNEALLEQLSAVMPEQIPITGVTDPAVDFAKITAAEYDISLTLSSAEDAGALRDFFGGSITVEKPIKKKKGRQYDPSQPQAKQVEVNAKLVDFCADGREIGIKVILPAGGETNINPSLVIAAAQKSVNGLDFGSIVRTRLFAGDAELR